MPDSPDPRQREEPRPMDPLDESLARRALRKAAMTDRPVADREPLSAWLRTRIEALPEMVGEPNDGGWSLVRRSDVLAALSQPAVPVAGAEDWYDRDAKAFARAHAQTGALRAAQPEDDGLDRSGVDDVGETERLTIENDLIRRMFDAMRGSDPMLKTAVEGSALDHVYSKVYSQLATLAENARKAAALATTQPERRDP